MNRKVLVVLIAGLALLCLAEPALAATSDVGRNLGREIKVWGSALLFGVACLASLPLLGKRDVNGGLILAGLVIVVGGFVFAPNSVRSVITGLWGSIGL